jgi:hypothetical protein
VNGVRKVDEGAGLTSAEATMTIEVSVADVVESGEAMVRVLRDELAANDDHAIESLWTLGASREASSSVVVDGARAIALPPVPAPVNDDAFVAEILLARDEELDADSLLAADPEFAEVCDARRDGWLVRIENEADACDE